MSQIERRIETLEKALNAGGGKAHIIFARDEEDSERQIREIRKCNPKARLFFIIEGLED